MISSIKENTSSITSAKVPGNDSSPRIRSTRSLNCERKFVAEVLDHRESAKEASSESVHSFASALSDRFLASMRRPIAASSALLKLPEKKCEVILSRSILATGLLRATSKVFRPKGRRKSRSNRVGFSWSGVLNSNTSSSLSRAASTPPVTSGTLFMKSPKLWLMTGPKPTGLDSSVSRARCISIVSKMMFGSNRFRSSAMKSSPTSSHRSCSSRRASLNVLIATLTTSLSPGIW
mmetsp:Transcript_21196/g.50269  ORF Transcript_21196/g.50269 Transcript_21196/m.50269 type:complete len:235 (-) Transcript_21196:127-831(-)